MRRWMKEHMFSGGLLLALLVVVCTFLVNTGGAWWGDRANVWELLMTLIYLAFWIVFTIVSSKYVQLAKIVFVFSLMTFISSVCAIIFSIKGGFVIAVILSALASVPFYGLRFFMNWTGVYVCAVIVSTVWVGFAWWNLRKLKDSKK